MIVDKEPEFAGSFSLGTGRDHETRYSGMSTRHPGPLAATCILIWARGLQQRLRGTQDCTSTQNNPHQDST
jgi:hypothetical protein